MPGKMHLGKVFTKKGKKKNKLNLKMRKKMRNIPKRVYFMIHLNKAVTIFVHIIFIFEEVGFKIFQGGMRV